MFPLMGEVGITGQCIKGITHFEMTFSESQVFGSFFPKRVMEAECEDFIGKSK